MARGLAVDKQAGNRSFLVGMVVFVLLVWGPLDHSWPYWFWIRSAYLVAIPVGVYFLLQWIWRRWQPDWVHEDRLMRIIAGSIAGACLIGVLNALQSRWHFECT